MECIFEQTGCIFWMADVPDVSSLPPDLAWCVAEKFSARELFDAEQRPDFLSLALGNELVPIWSWFSAYLYQFTHSSHMMQLWCFLILCWDRLWWSMETTLSKISTRGLSYTCIGCSQLPSIRCMGSGWRATSNFMEVPLHRTRTATACRPPGWRSTLNLRILYP